MNSNNDLQDKVAVVTGSSTGIGAVIAVELARCGAKVILHGKTPSEELDATAQQVTAIAGTAESLCCDFADSDAVDKFAEDAWNRLGVVDILINNAGGDVLTGTNADWTPIQKLDYLYATDCRATFQLCRKLGARMKQTAEDAGLSSGERAIVNIGWDQALQGMAGDSGQFFSAIKGSIMSLTLSLAQSLAPQIRVNCVAPGWIQTQWGEQTSQYWNQRAVAESLMNRWGTPQDVANAVSFLVSNRANFVSGQILNVNGGFRFDRNPENV